MYAGYDSNYVYGYEDRDLGIAPLALVGTATNVVQKIPIIGSIFGGGSKDAGRLASNADAYKQALSNPISVFKDQGIQPTAFLLMKSPTSKGGQGGWATAAAQNDAYSKYTSAMSSLKSKGYTANSDGSVNPPTSSNYQPQTGTKPGAPVAQAGLLGGIGGTPILLGGAALLAFAVLSKRK